MIDWLFELKIINCTRQSFIGPVEVGYIMSGIDLFELKMITSFK